MPVYDKWTVGADSCYSDDDSKASVNRANIGNVNIDSLVFGINLGYEFSLTP